MVVMALYLKRCYSTRREFVIVGGKVVLIARELMAFETSFKTVL